MKWHRNPVAGLPDVVIPVVVLEANPAEVHMEEAMRVEANLDVEVPVEVEASWLMIEVQRKSKTMPKPSRVIQFRWRFPRSMYPRYPGDP